MSLMLVGTSGSVAFEPRARLIKLIGGELVSDEVVAVTELVKNAYDADARTVHLEFRDVTSEGGEIVIWDDGYGMTLQDLTDYWMQPGGTTKRGQRSRTSRGGRRVLGEKGIGRFAVDKLGTGLVITSRKKGQGQEVLCTFDWSAFEHDTRMLSEVACVWQLRPSETVKRQGTMLRITGLRAHWNERLFRKLCLRLGRLRSPFGSADDFKIVIDSNDFPDYSGELGVDYLQRAPHQIDAHFDGDQTVTVTRAGVAEELTWNGEGHLDCGPVRVRLYGFDLETPAIAKLGPPRDVRGWLREWTGVSIYRDGFRLSPYGESNDDWLRLDQRRVNNPMVRLSNNQVIGFVEINGVQNALLVDQTNREGMISNKAFADLRRLVLFMMQQLEATRQHARHPSRRGTEKLQNSSSTAKQSVADELDELGATDKPVSPAKVKAIARKVRESLEREQRSAKALADGYAELAAVGQVAEEALRRIGGAMDSLERQLATGSSGRQSAQLSAQFEVLRNELAILDPVQSHHGARRRAIDLDVELGRAGEAFAARLEERGIRLELPTIEALVRLEMRPENLQRVLAILFNNSLDWLHRTTDPRIRISVEPDASEGHCAVLFSDNGPGIPASMIPRVFEPLETGREGARGMGLTIARNIVEGVGGTIEVVEDGRRRGTTLRMLLPRKRTRAVRGR